jgi:hypothetical protein
VLLVSAFLWHHSKANFVNAWSIGVVVVASSPSKPVESNP